MIIGQARVGALRRGELTTHLEPQGANRRCRYTIGNSYAVQTGPGQPHVLEVEVLGVATGMVNDVDDRLAQAQGFGDAGEFFAHWRQRFHQVADPAPGPMMVDEPVWIVWFRVAHDPTRLLSKRPGSQRADYTRNRHQAMADEPEAVSATVQAGQTAEAHMRYRRRWRERQEQWEAMTLSQQAVELERLLAHGGANGLVRRDLLVAQERMGKAHRKLVRDEEDEAA